MQCNKRGFTIVELMIAMVIFSVASLMTTGIVIGMSRQYQKGSYTAQLNDASRTVHQDIRDAIAYSKAFTPIANSGSIRFFCASNNLYYWDQTIPGTIRYGLYKRSLTASQGCTAANASGGANLLPSNGFVGELSINQSGDIYNVYTRFNVGTSDMFTNANYTNCLPTLRGGDFCSVVNYNSSVVSRL